MSRPCDSLGPMPTVDAAVAALLAAATLHLGFQVTVTVLVYPALVRAPDWERVHPLHTRAITPLVVVVYGALVLAGGWALVATWLDPWVLLSVAGAGAAMLATALVAGPAHGKLAEDKKPELVRRLLSADRVRALGALVSSLGAVLAALS